MTAVAILAAIKSAFEVLKSLRDIGQEAKPLFDGIYNVVIKGNDATQVDVDQLIALTDQWSAEIQQPLPPEEA